MIFRGTTPAVPINTSQNLMGYSRVIVTFEDRGGTEVDVVGPGPDLSITASQIIARLSQEQTLALEPGPVKIQIRAVDGAGHAVASFIMKDEVKDVLKEGVIVV